MKQFQYLVRIFVICAIMFVPVGSGAADNGSEAMTQVTCQDTWQGVWSMISTQKQSASEIFCDHFMGAKDIFDGGGKNSTHHVVTPFLIFGVTVDFPPSPSVKTAIPSQYVPYSLHPEVAPHPPKSI